MPVIIPAQDALATLIIVPPVQAPPHGSFPMVLALLAAHPTDITKFPAAFAQLVPIPTATPVLELISAQLALVGGS
jgi:hypothetical protein